MLADLLARFVVVSLAVLGGVVVGVGFLQLVLCPLLDKLDRLAGRLWNRPPDDRGD